jgi:solute carrier family 13 (sodium-dependent dicarboxylate transporter), member 2/3/5
MSEPSSSALPPTTRTEFAGALTPAEERFEAWRRRVGIFLAPLIFLGVLLWPLPLTPEAHRVAAIVAATVCLWITEAIPLAVSGILGPTLAVVLGVTTANKAFAPFADPIMFLFLGSFILTRAIYHYQLDRRVAYLVLTQTWINESPARILFAYGAVCCGISMWISNTAATAMMFPIGIALINTLRQVNNRAITKGYASAVMLMCAFAASVGGLATPVGTPTNIIGLGFIEQQLHRKVSFLEWMSFGVPIVIVLYLLLFVCLYLLCGQTVKQRLQGVRTILLAEQAQLGQMSPGERNTLIAFLITVTLWVMPGILALTLGDKHPWTLLYAKRLPESAAALLGAALLFLLPINWKKHEFTLTIKEAVNIDWAVMALYGGGIALGNMVFDTKLANTIGENLTGLLPTGGYGLVGCVAIITTIASELTSNVAAANMVIPVVIAIAGAAGLQPAMGACLASSLGFMMPISTPGNAIVYSSGYVPLTTMVKYGLLIDLGGAVVITVGTMLLVGSQ